MRDYPLATQAEECAAGKARRLDITLRQNIDEQIAAAEAQVKTLQDTKERLKASGLLDARIDDIQRSMRY